MKSRADLMTIEGFDSLEIDTSGNPCVWENHYDDGKGCTWTDVWSCQCDSDDYSPMESVWIAPSDNTLRALWEALPEAGTTDPSPLYGRSRRPSFTIAELASLLVELGPEDDQHRNPLYDKIQNILLEELDPNQRAVVDAYRNAVEPKDGQCEMDSDAEVSLGEDHGAYVMVWTWVPGEDAGFMPEWEDDV